ncbi:predicted protein [Chaetomium globosum CBS 148.51]|uniref:Uncharacterized protein n=1 Tax=Chaetomium globosum (strain ATCC 6205 / CBS 148.51 / DSM 1962 / NBRC 6347 / NRRL 1970) TaxID=306901 RepID=Q2HEV3_CHAGB|nr:uncharacterized protein CHGG_01251 [Chaetomium globosum CBS 148.51]EAQ93016.1 predicted protein [Chaetomium globosum CBS 148.51]
MTSSSPGDDTRRHLAALPTQPSKNVRTGARANPRPFRGGSCRFRTSAGDLPPYWQFRVGARCCSTPPKRQSVLAVAVTALPEDFSPNHLSRTVPTLVDRSTADIPEPIFADSEERITVVLHRVTCRPFIGRKNQSWSPNPSRDLFSQRQSGGGSRRETPEAHWHVDQPRAGTSSSEPETFCTNIAGYPSLSVIGPPQGFESRKQLTLVHWVRRQGGKLANGAKFSAAKAKSRRVAPSEHESVCSPTGLASLATTKVWVPATCDSGQDV